MGGLRSHSLQLAIAIVFVCGISACGGHHTQGASPFPGKVNLSPGGTSSVQVGSTINFSASAQNSAGTNVSVSFLFDSSDTSILNIAPNGVACAGIWDTGFTTCTPAGVGVVKVTASALGITSTPTYVFVHPPIDNIVVSGVLPTGAFVQEPCLPQGQSMTVQAQAFSRGVDVTASVGPFVWSANNSSVVRLTSINNSGFNFPTNQATATASTPGVTQIFAAASGVTSTSFRQPDLKPSPAVTFDFFETCPVQSITLELAHAGSEITDFAAAKGAPQTVVATITDVLGNSSLQNSNNGVVLSKIPLTWTATQPAVIAVGSGCTESCSISTPSPGAGSVTASCTPPSCNAGFPQVPLALSPSNLPACTSYIQSVFPQIKSCEAFIPRPVYASPLPNKSTAAISGFVTGAPGTSAILATSQDCSYAPPSACLVGLYAFGTGRSLAGGANYIPTSPNSLRFDLTGDRAYMGSAFGAQILNPANLGTASNPFSAIGTVTGRVIGVSPNGSLAIFSDALHTPNQVYVVNASNAASPSITALSITQASVAGFTPDNLKAYIFGLDSNGLPNLYVYSTVQALQVIPLPAQTAVDGIAFSTNGAFTYIAGPSVAGGAPGFSVLNTCDNRTATDPTNTVPQTIPLTSSPVSFKALPDGVHFVALESNGTIDYITASISSDPPTTLTSPANYLCSTTSSGTLVHSMTVTHSVRNINLNLGNSRPLDFFVSSDGTLLYVLSSDLNSIIVYNFALGSVTGGIQLVSTAGGINPTPVAAQMTADAGALIVAGSDGYIHQISTANGGTDIVQTQFSNLPNYSNPFCSYSPSSGPCQLDLIAVRP